MTTPVQIEYADNGREYVTPWGRLENGRSLGDVVPISISIVARCLLEEYPVCRFARQFLPDGSGYVTQRGMFILHSASRVVEYELFPAVFPNSSLWPSVGETHIYVGVKTSDCYL